MILMNTQPKIAIQNPLSNASSLCGYLGWIGFHARAGRDGTETKKNMKRFISAHVGRVIDYHVMT